MEEISQGFALFIEKLDWVYIFTFTFIAYLINKGIDKLPATHPLKRISTAWVVFIVGLIYAVALFFIRKQDGGTLLIESMIVSLPAAMVLHGLLIKYLLNWITSLMKKG